MLLWMNENFQRYQKVALWCMVAFLFTGSLLAENHSAQPVTPTQNSGDESPSKNAIHQGDAITKGGAENDLPLDAVKQLSSEQFAVRERAYKTLEVWSKKHTEQAPEKLYEVWSAGDDPEMKSRCFVIMKKSVIERKFGKGEGFVGIMMQIVQFKGQKVLAIMEVVDHLPGMKEKTPAKKSGLKAGDRILGIDKLDFLHLPKEKKGGNPIPMFQEYVKSKSPGDEVVIHLFREGKHMEKKLILIKRPTNLNEVADPFNPFGTNQKDQKKEKEDAYFEKWLESQKGKNH